MAQNIELSFARKPLVVVSFHGLPTDAEFEAYLKALHENLQDALRRRMATAVLLDTTQEPNPVSAAHRRRQAEWLKENYEALRLGCAGTAFVISSTLVRGAMTAVLWLQDLPYPYATFKTCAEGEAWCLERLAAANAQQRRWG